MKTHKCMAIHCQIDLPQSKLMCARHWRGLPADIRSEVLKGYASRRAGEPGGEADHLAAIRKAVKFYMFKQQERDDQEASQKNVEK